MDHFKSYFFKVVMLLTVLFSYTSCGPKRTPYEECKYGVNIHHGLNKSLVECAAYAIRNYQYQIFLYAELRYEYPYKNDEIKDALYSIPNPNYNDCADALKPFAEFAPLINNTDLDDGEGTSVEYENTVIPNHLDGSEMPAYMIDFEELTEDEELEKYRLQRRIMYNALYNNKQGLNLQNLPNTHQGGKYGAIFLDVVADKIQLIGEDFTPKQFCQLRYNEYDE